MGGFEAFESKSLNNILRVPLHVDCDGVAFRGSRNVHAQAPGEVAFVRDLKFLVQFGHEATLQGQLSSAQQQVINIY